MVGSYWLAAIGWKGEKKANSDITFSLFLTNRIITMADSHPQYPW